MSRTLPAKLKGAIHFLLAVAAYWRYGRPSRKLIVIGVTGTKGKSTTCRFIASVLLAAGYRVGLLSTVEFQIADRRWLNDKKMTMLGRGEIQRMLRDMVKAGCRYAVVETSSEGILQYRHYGLNYDVAVFTNLGTEHSERHGGRENLKQDKGKMFRALDSGRKIIDGQKVPKVIVANLADPEAGFYLCFRADKKYGYAVQQPGRSRSDVPRPDVADNPVELDKNFIATIQSTTAAGTDFSVGAEQYHLNLPGEFNVANALAAIAVGETQRVSYQRRAAGLAEVKYLPGRMEWIDAGQPFKVVVDYAHEPLSYRALFSTLRAMLGLTNKLIAVIGSDGGGRDVGKRGPMGEIAGQLCDYVVVSDVNCFDDDPKEIAEMLASGARRAGKKDDKNLFISVDRRAGIAKALALARPGDVVAITAKGTEPCICVANGRKIPWDDRNVTKELLGDR